MSGCTCVEAHPSLYLVIGCSRIGTWKGRLWKARGFVSNKGQSSLLLIYRLRTCVPCYFVDTCLLSFICDLLSVVQCLVDRSFTRVLQRVHTQEWAKRREKRWISRAALCMSSLARDAFLQSSFRHRRPCSGPAAIQASQLRSHVRQPISSGWLSSLCTKREQFYYLGSSKGLIQINIVSKDGTARATAGGRELSDVLGLPGGKKREYSLPSSVEESVDQARQASRQAINDGKKRLQLELLLPLIGATDLDDWPGGIQQQYKAAAPLVSSLLRGLLEGDSFKEEDGGCHKYIIDSSDAVGCWESEKIALVLFPTPETLDRVEALAAVDGRPLLLVNSQWQPGQVVSDFGFGARRKAREGLVNSFEMVYYLKRMRMLGEDVRILRRYPGDWQVFVMDALGNSECVAVEGQPPSYKQLQQILKSRKGSKAGLGWFDRLLGELKFNQESLKSD